MPVRIAIFQRDLGIGGIQKSLISLLQSDAVAGCSVNLFLSDKASSDSISLPDNVRIFELPRLPYCSRAVKFDPLGLFTRYYKNKIPGEYDCAIDFDGYSPDTAAAALSANAAMRTIWVHNDYEKRAEYSTLFKYRFAFSKSKYYKFNKIVGVSRGAIDGFKKMVPGCTQDAIVIPNLVNTTTMFDLATEDCPVEVDRDKINIVSIGRLERIKGYRELLADFEDASRQRSDLELYLIGDGPDRDYLEKQVDSGFCSDRIHFLGKISNPYSVLSKMDAFCLESYYEGQGIVIKEAQAFGLQIIVPKRLEKYNDGLVGCDNVSSALVQLKKKDKLRDNLEDYNEAIIRKIVGLWAQSGLYSEETA